MVELLVALATGLFLLAGVLGIFSSTVNSQSNTLQMTRLNQELRTAMDLMTRDMRRAGYWSLAADTVRPAGTVTPSAITGVVTLTSSDGAFGAVGADITGLSVVSPEGAATIVTYLSATQVAAVVTNNFSAPAAISNGRWMITNPFHDSVSGNDITVSGSCVSYTYDRNGDAVVDNNERFGFRLNGSALQMHTGGAIDCSTGAGTWETITSDIVNITALNFDTSATTCINLSDASSDCNPSSAGYVAPATGDLLLWTRHIRIAVSGQLTNNATVARTLAESVRLRNDRLVVD